MRLQVTSLAAALLLLLAGCGSTTSPAPASAPASASSTPAATPAAPSGSATALQAVHLRLPFLVGAYDDPYYLAAAKGYYKQAGFNVSILQGTGSLTTAETVANGSDTFGVTDSATAAQLISKGAPLKVLAVFTQITPLGFEYNPSDPVNTPKDLIGRPLVSSAGGAETSLLPAVLSKYGMNMNQVKIDYVAPSAYAQTFMRLQKQHQKPVMLGLEIGDYQRLLVVDPKAQAKTFADFGVNLYSYGLVTSTNEIAAHPKAVGRFVAASVKGWEDALKQPQSAAAAAVAAVPSSGQFVQSAGMKLVVKMVHTPATQGQVPGWMAKSDWQQTLSLLQRYGGVKTVLPLDKYYTNQFIPQS